MSETEGNILHSQASYDREAALHDPKRLHQQLGSGSSLWDARDLVGELLITGGAEAIKAGRTRTASMIREQVALGSFLGGAAKEVVGEIIFSLNRRSRG